MQIAFNAHSQALFDSLPQAVREVITAQQLRIENAVLSKYPSARPTSGFRCACYNRILRNSLPDSLHIWGAARDYSRIGLPDNISVPGFRVIKEGTCFHVEIEVKR